MKMGQITIDQIQFELSKNGVMPKSQPSLDKIKQSFIELQKDHNIKHNKNQHIHIAGTNAKGSTAKAIQYAAIANNKKVGFYSSPHILKINERLNYNLQDISDQEFIESYLACKKYIDHYELSHFDAITIMAYYWFHHYCSDFDFIIWEIGLGGLWDSTNAIAHQYNIITNISFDHQEYLGNSLQQIASNKLGIIAENSVSMIGNLDFWQKQDSEATNFALDYIKNKNSQLIASSFFPEKQKSLKSKIQIQNSWPQYYLYFANQSNKQFSITTEQSSNTTSFAVSKNSIPNTLGNLEIKLSAELQQDFPIALMGQRACDNLNLAFDFCTKVLNLDALKVLKSFANIHWPARMQKVKLSNMDIFVSGDHNIHGLISLSEIINHIEYKKLHLLVGFSGERDPEILQNVQKNLKNKNIEYYFISPQFKGIAKKKYLEYCQNNFIQNFHILDSFAEYENLIKQTHSTEDLYICSGSLYLAGDFLNYIQQNQKN